MLVTANDFFLFYQNPSLRWSRFIAMIIAVDVRPSFVSLSQTAFRVGLLSETPRLSFFECR